MNLTKVSPKFSLMKNLGNNFIFLPAFYLIMWVMKASKNFGKKHFGNRRVDFPKQCQNSFWQNSPEIMQFQD